MTDSWAILGSARGARPCSYGGWLSIMFMLKSFLPCLRYVTACLHIFPEWRTDGISYSLMMPRAPRTIAKGAQRMAAMISNRARIAN